MHLALWAGVCLLAGLALAKLPLRAAITSLALYLLLPAASSKVFTGIPYSTGKLGLHPATWFLLALTAGVLLRSPRLLASCPRYHARGALLLGLVLAGAIVISFSQRGTSGLAQILECYLAPLLMLLTLGRAASSAGNIRLLRQALLAIGLLVALLAIVELGLGRDLLWGPAYSSTYPLYGFQGGSGFRPSTTLDHPLNTALLLLICLPISHAQAVLRIPKWVSMVVLLVGLGATQSRAAAVLAGLYLVYRAVRQIYHRPAGFLGLTLILSAALYAVLSGSFGLHLTQRFSDDAGSNAVRQVALQSLSGHWGDYIFVGGGVGSAASLSAMLTGTNHSFENAYVIGLVDIGGVGVVLWVLGWLVATGWKARPNVLVAPALLALIDCASFSSFGVKSTAGILVAAACALAASDPVADESRPGEEVSRLRVSS